MLVHPRIANARPLIVVGPPRCGTRFAANALNQHPRIRVNNEIPTMVVDATVQYLERMTAIYRAIAAGETGKASWADGWLESRHTILYAMWSTLTKVPPARPAGPVSWYGYKTPYHEAYWRFYRDFFGEQRPPKFVMCIRNFVDHYLSSEAMTPWPIARRAARYRQAINHYADMRAELGGSNASLFVLDDLPAGGVDYVRTALFDNLGIPVDDATLAHIAPDQRSNDGASKGRTKRALTGKEEAFLAANPDLRTALDTVRAGKHIALPPTD